MKNEPLPTLSDFQHNGCSVKIEDNFKPVGCGEYKETPTSYLIIPNDIDMGSAVVREALKDIQKERGANHKIIIVGAGHPMAQQMMEQIKNIKPSEVEVLNTRGFGNHHSAEKSFHELSKNVELLKRNKELNFENEYLNKPNPHPFQKFIGKKKY